MAIRAVGKEILPALPFHAIGLLVAFGLKAHAAGAGADDLAWILAPTSRLAGLLAGSPFEREAGAGWVSHAHRLILGPSCAGLNFLIIAFSAFFLSLVHRIEGALLRGAWLGTSLAGAYVVTVAANAVRIVAAMRLYEMDIYAGPVTPQRVHRLAGTVVYGLALLLAYPAAERVLDGLRRSGAGGDRRSSPPPGPRRPRRAQSLRLDGLLTPLLWYLAFALAVPLLNRAGRRDGGMFLEHAATVLSVCLILAVAGVALLAGLRGGGRRGAARAASDTTPP